MDNGQQVSIKCPICGSRIADMTAETREHAKVYADKKCPPQTIQVKCRHCKQAINIKL